jgi:hypothetical protein
MSPRGLNSGALFAFKIQGEKKLAFLKAAPLLDLLMFRPQVTSHKRTDKRVSADEI